MYDKATVQPSCQSTINKYAVNKDKLQQQNFLISPLSPHTENFT